MEQYIKLRFEILKSLSSCIVFPGLHNEAKRCEVLFLINNTIDTYEALNFTQLSHRSLLLHLQRVIACNVLPVFVYEEDAAHIVATTIMGGQVPDFRLVFARNHFFLVTVVGNGRILEDR